MPKPRVQHRFKGILEEKHCSGCDDWKLLKEFSKNKRSWDGLQSSCKVCQNIAKNKWRRKLGIKPRLLAEHRSSYCRAKHRFKGEEEEKHCSGCDEWKVLKEFSKCKAASDGLQVHCKVCKKNKPYCRAKHRFKGEKEEKHCSGCDEWKMLKEFYKCKDGLQSHCKVCKAIAHKKKMRTEYGRELVRSQTRNNNRKRRANGKTSAYLRKRYREDPAFSIMCRLRRRVNQAIKRQGATKSKATMKLLGCTLAFFRSYIEKQFVDGMTWENRDKWHIDHRVPCAAFNMLDPLEQRYCFWYKNHQPMWANDNLCKKDKYKQEDKERLIKAWIFENVFKNLINV